MRNPGVLNGVSHFQFSSFFNFFFILFHWVIFRQNWISSVRKLGHCDGMPSTHRDRELYWCRDHCIRPASAWSFCCDNIRRSILLRPRWWRREWLSSVLSMLYFLNLHLEELRQQSHTDHPRPSPKDSRCFHHLPIGYKVLRISVISLAAWPEKLSQWFPLQLFCQLLDWKLLDGKEEVSQLPTTSNCHFLSESVTLTLCCWCAGDRSSRSSP